MKQGKLEMTIIKLQNKVIGGELFNSVRKEVVSIDLFCVCFVSFLFNGVNSQSKKGLSISVLKVAFSNFVLLSHSPLEPFWTNYDVICRKPKHIVTDSIVQK